MAVHVRITDVSPRDGLQNEPLSPGGDAVPTTDKLRLVSLLAHAHVDEIELTSFVDPKWVPQLADAADLIMLVAKAFAGKQPGAGRPVFSVLVPNAKGMERLLDVHERARQRFGTPIVDRIALFTAASETFSQKNTNASIEQSLRRFGPVLDMAREAHLGVRGYVSCAVECPFEGPIAPTQVADVSRRLWELGNDRGLDEIDLGDTIGKGTAQSTRAMLAAVQTALPKHARITLHLHDTFGNAAQCVRTALDMGVTSFDGAAGGLGGCPFASTKDGRAPGNIDTALLVNTCTDAGFECNTDAVSLAQASAFARSLKHRGSASVTQIETHRDGGVLHIRLNRPDKRNALTPTMLAALDNAINAASTDDRAILLSGNGPAFCAGFDLSLCEDNDTALDALLTGLGTVVRSLRNATQPVVIAVHGAAIAGGCALLGGADVIVATRDAKLGYPVVKLGISPAVSAPFLARAGGQHATGGARDVLLDPTLSTAEDFAHRTGIAMELVDTQVQAHERATEIAVSLAAKSTHALVHTKHWLNEIEGSLADAQRGLDVSLSLASSKEVQSLLPRVWSTQRS